MPCAPHLSALLLGVKSEATLQDGRSVMQSKRLQARATAMAPYMCGRYVTLATAPAPPPGVTLSDGSITAAEFSATFQTGMMAHTIGESNR